MEQKTLQIDVADVARQALRERQAGEDLDEALLRVCKRIYGESGLMAFQAIRKALESLAERNNVDAETALQQIADGRSPISVVTSVISTQKTVVGSLDELPSDLRAEVEKALAAGKSGQVVITKEETKKRSIWSRLFGR